MREKAFKSTDVGMIPNDWSQISLGEIGEPRMCKRIMKHQTSDVGDVPFFKIGTFGYEPDAFISRDLFEEYKSKYNYPRIGDVLISAAGTIGRLVVYKGQDAYYQDSNIVWLENDESKVLNSFLYHCLRDTSWDTSQGTISRLYNNSLKEKSIAVPTSLDEQQKIADALNDMDTLIGSLIDLIEKKRNIRSGAIQELLTGKKRLKGFDKPWVEASLPERCTLKARIGWQGLRTDEYQPFGDYLLITGTDLVDGSVKWDTCNYVSEWRYAQDPNIQVKNGDVLITKDGTIGKVGYVENLPGPATLNSGVFVVRSKDTKVLTCEYLNLIFKSPSFEDFIKQLKAGSTIVHLYQKDFVKFNLYYPESVDEQLAIASIISDMDKEIAALEQKRTKYEAMKKGMMQDLLTGKIRLV